MHAMDKAIADDNGWREFPDNPLSRVGVFEYLGKEIDPSLEPDRIYMVYRPAEELASPETIASFRLVPWILGHTMLGDNYETPAEEIGISGVVGENVYFSDGVLYGNIKMFSTRHDRTISEGLKELSLGYTCSYEFAQGEFEGQPYDFVQRELRGNHVATVRSGRMGASVAVQDTKQAKAMNMNMNIDEMSVEELVALAKALLPKLRELGQLAAVLGEPEAVVEEVSDNEEVVDTDNEEIKVADTDPEGEVKVGYTDPDTDETKVTDNDPDETKTVAGDSIAAVMRAIGNRDRLAAKLKPIVGAFDHSAMTEGQVASYGLKKLGITAAPKQAVAALTGYIQGHKAAAPTTTRARAAGDSAATAIPSFLKSHV